MNQTAAQPLTTPDLVTDTQASTNIHFFSNLPPLETSAIPTFTELLAEYKASVSKPQQVAWNSLSRNASVGPFAVYQTNLAKVKPQPVHWLWQKRLPLSGITLLDGDHGCGKSLLALHIAACISSGTPSLDGSTTLPGGVVIVSPHNDATTTQIQLLTALGADLSRIEILSYIQEPASSSHTGSAHPFSIPEDLTHLLQAIERLDARLVIFDPFISLLSRTSRLTNQHLGHLLANLNQHLIEHNVACLLIRNCTARGGYARPSVIERSDHFANTTTSRLLLTSDPMHPDRLLIAHAASHHTALTPTITLQIQHLPEHPANPHITVHGSHSLKAKYFIENRPDTLHRRLLFQHLQTIIAAATNPIPVATLYAYSPYSSPFQVQRTLSDLLHMGQIEHPARGFYTPAPTIPVPPFKSTGATSPVGQPTKNLKSTGATSPSSQQALSHKISAAATLKSKAPKRPHKGRSKHRNTKKRH